MGIDMIFRLMNKHKLLVVMYHGITTKTYDPPIWTQLPLQTFRKQLDFLESNYTCVSLGDVISAIRTSTPLPERSVLLTFDDGIRNNFSVAFPELQKRGLPAAIFLTVDYIGTGKFLWADELLLLLQQAASLKISPCLPDSVAQHYFQMGEVWKAYEITVESLKRAGKERRESELARLRSMVPLDHRPLLEDFGILTWDEIHAMKRSGLIDFGVHTATHRILTELTEDEWEKEIAFPKLNLEAALETEISAFCFPNGRPGDDFTGEHMDYLRKTNYSCAFSTDKKLFVWPGGDCMSIGRIAGYEGELGPAYFRLNASGTVRFVKDMVSRLKGQIPPALEGVRR